jgi:hypothetical protein
MCKFSPARISRIKAHLTTLLFHLPSPHFRPSVSPSKPTTFSPRYVLIPRLYKCWYVPVISSHQMAPHSCVDVVPDFPSAHVHNAPPSVLVNPSLLSNRRNELDISELGVTSKYPATSLPPPIPEQRRPPSLLHASCLSCRFIKHPYAHLTNPSLA